MKYPVRSQALPQTAGVRKCPCRGRKECQAGTTHAGSRTHVIGIAEVALACCLTARSLAPRRGGLAVRSKPARFMQDGGIGIVKAIGWIVLAIFIIGLLVVLGLLGLIF